MKYFEVNAYTAITFVQLYGTYIGERVSNRTVKFVCKSILGYSSGALDCLVSGGCGGGVQFLQDRGISNCRDFTN